MRRVPTDPGSSDPHDQDPTSRQLQGRRQALSYQGAIEAVASIGIGGALGFFADDYFDTSPFLLLIGFAFGFSAFFVRLVRLKRFLESSEKPPDRPE